MLITPRGIDNRLKQQGVLEEFRHKLQGLQRFDWNQIMPFGQPDAGRRRTPSTTGE